jgi:hypothetical protein
MSAIEIAENPQKTGDVAQFAVLMSPDSLLGEYRNVSRGLSFKGDGGRD